MSSLVIFFNFAFFFLFIFCPGHCLKEISFTCAKLTACQCIFPVGQGIDLSKLNDNQPSTQPWLLGTSGNSSIYFHPCSDVLFPGDNECSSGASVCLFDNATKQFTALGKVGEATFVSRSLTDPVYLKYVNNNITTEILLKCDPNAITSILTEDSGSTKNNYKLTLQSVHACHESMDASAILGDPAVDRSLSTGSVLVILFFTFSAVYFFGGALLLKLMRGAEGKELVPNYDFWSGLPGLVKDGAMFVCSGCQAAASYDRI